MEKNEDCIFCKIVAGEIPSYKVYEDDDTLAFLDIHPQSPGHVQVIPKEHHRWVWDVPEIGKCFEVVRSIAKAQQAAFDTDMIVCRVYGDEVPHAHVWIFPNPESAHGNKDDLEENAQKIRAMLAAQIRG